jgi:hypothetical protein
VRALDSNTTFSPTGEPQPDGALSIPLHIKLNPASDVVGAQEIDLVLSVLDDIVQEMQRMEAEWDSDIGVVRTGQPQSIFSCNCC